MVGGVGESLGFLNNSTNDFLEAGELGDGEGDMGPFVSHHGEDTGHTPLERQTPHNP